MHENGDILDRILSKKEINGRNYYKLYFIVDEEIYNMLTDLLDLAGRDIDSVFIDAITQYYNRLLQFSEKEEREIKDKEDVRRDISELKNMLKRLEKRIKEAVSEVLNKAQPVIVQETGLRERTKRRTKDIEVDMPELQVVEATGTEKEGRVSLEDAIAQAIVVAIDDELQSVIGKIEKEEENKGN